MATRTLFRDEFLVRPANRALPVRMHPSKPISNVRFLSCSRHSSKWKCHIEGLRFGMFVENRYVTINKATVGLGEADEIHFSWERPATCRFDPGEDELDCR